MTSHSNAANGLDGMDHLVPLKEARDPNSGRYKLLPEKIEPGSLATSNSVTMTEQTKGKSTSLFVTLAEAAPTPEKVTPIPEIKPVTIQQQPPQTATTSSPPIARTQSFDLGVESQTAPAHGKVNPLGPTAAAPYGYKIVTVKKPDGTIVKVKRPLKEGEQQSTIAKKTNLTSDKKTVTQPSTHGVATRNTTTKSGSPAMLEKAAHTSPSLVPESTNHVMCIEAAPTSVRLSVLPPTLIKETTLETSKLAAISEKQIGQDNKVHVTEKELEQAGNPRQIDLAQDNGSKSARRVAKIAKLIVWTVGIMFPLFFLGK